jgi:hypothetical protein
MVHHNSVDAIYLDFQKAFDTVPHHRLFTKLKGYGISGNILEWIKNFLSERKQKVVLNGSTSTNFIVVGLNRLRLEPTIYLTSGEQLNHYTTDEPTDNHNSVDHMLYT